MADDKYYPDFPKTLFDDRPTVKRKPLKGRSVSSNFSSDPDTDAALADTRDPIEPRQMWKTGAVTGPRDLKRRTSTSRRMTGRR